MHRRSCWETRPRSHRANTRVGEGCDRPVDVAFRRRDGRGSITCERMGEKVVWQMLKRYAAEVGVPGIAPHQLWNLRQALSGSGRRA
jgi:hypothetical protein